MYVLVTSATGFVGGRFGPTLLTAGHRVRALVRDRMRDSAPDGVGPGAGEGDTSPATRHWSHHGTARPTAATARVDG
jgi:uncharacterized protein YbjT (DUF2867 family)